MADGSRKDRRAQVRLRIDRSIRLRVTIYSVIFLVMAVLVVVDVVRIGGPAVLPVLLCLVGGVVVGLVVSRMFRLGWDEVSGRVVGRLDVTQVTTWPPLQGRRSPGPLCPVIVAGAT